MDDVPTETMTTDKTARPGPTEWARPLIPGTLVVIVIAAVATGVGQLLPLLGAPVAGIVIGVALSAALRSRTALAPGVRFSSKFILQLAVVILGSQLSLREVADVGAGSLPVMLGTLVICLLVAWFVGRRLGIESDTVTLIGVGTAICGASAIAAVSPVIKARSSQIAYAISTIFLFNVAAVLLFPPLGHLLHMSQDSFGLFAGTAVNDTSSVVAAATTYGAEAGNHAVVVKLVRTLMIIPICLGLSALVARRTKAAGEIEQPSGIVQRVTRLVPWFLIGFVLVAAANSVGVVPGSSHVALQHTSLFLITMALGAIGLSTDAAAVRRAGARPLLLGAILWVTVASSSLLLQWATT